MNLLLLCGLDGTGLLFKPFLETIPLDIRNNIELLMYDFNADDDNVNNQDVTYQAECIERQVYDKFADESVVIIAESYSGLLAYQLLLREAINIERVFFIACFLQQPSQIAYLAKYAYFIKPKWTSIISDKLLSYLLFNRFGSAGLLALFRQAMTQLEHPKKRELFIRRCHNISKLPKNLPKVGEGTTEHQVVTPCVYLQANQDNLVQANNAIIFQRLFTNLTIVPLDGSHFLLQTNPKGVWNVFSRFFRFMDGNQNTI